ncbi:MAG: hypothetical protein IK022_07620 [Bacteroidales bacterium]|nr:hypothetical protein [Bacteroidales bacterium]
MRHSKLHIEAFSLPTVIIISVLILLLILFAFSMKAVDLQNYTAFHIQKQSRMDLNSATALYMCDSAIMKGADSISIQLYDDGEAPISLERRQWGLYEMIAIGHSKEDPFRRRYMMGRKSECDNEAALWLCDRNRALSLAGRASISGLVYIPLNGINFIKIAGEKYSGDQIDNEMLRISGRSLPEVSEDVWTYLDSLERQSVDTYDFRNVPGSGKYLSFDEPTAKVHCDIPGTTEFHLNGNVILYGSRITISGKSEIRDILIHAGTVTIESGFRGSAQIFCTDSVRIQSGVTLEYPSGIFLNSAGEDPCVTIKNGSRVDGYVAVYDGDRYDYALEHPCLRLERGADIRGLVYMDGSCDIAGSIKGATYIKDCFYRGNGNMYAGTLYDTRIEREDSLAFPIMLDGPYRRKIIKKVY